MNFTSAAIGSTGQSLDGVNVSTSAGPALFLEAVAISDPNDGGAIAPVSSTLGLTVNVASTVAQVVNVSTTVNVATSTQITSSVPMWVSQSSAPWSVSGTVSTQVISSIPFFVSQSSSPWVVSSAPIALTGTSQVFGAVSSQIVSSIPLLVSQTATSNPWIVAGTTSVNVLGTASTFPLGTTSTQIVSSIPFFVAQSSSPWTVIGAHAISTMTAVASTWPLNTTMVNVVSSIPFFVAQSSSPWGVNGGINVTAASAQFSTFPTGVASVTAIPSSQGGLSAVFKLGLTTASFTVKATAGKLHDLWFTNLSTSTRWLKLYNASSAAVGTTAPYLTFGMPGTTTGANAIAGWIASAMGIQFSTAIFAACTASSATSTDTSAPTATDIVINFGFV